MDTKTCAEIVRDPRDGATKVRLFRERFSGQANVYGTYDPQTGRSWQVKAPVTDKVVLDHLQGKRPYGVYLLVGDRTRAAVIDFDKDDPGPVLECVGRAEHYGIAMYIERSKAKGFHLWSFFRNPGVQAWKARSVLRHILDEIGNPNVEVFPKQDRLSEDTTNYGNFINAPLFWDLVHQGKTVFLDPKRGLAPFPNQWEFLERAEAVSEDTLDEVIQLNGLGQNQNHSRVGKPCISLGVFGAAGAFPACAKTMLRNGVTENQRVACFRLAVHLRRAGLPYDLTVAALAEWARKNRPSQGQQIISETEIKTQAASAYLREYRGNGCEEPAVTAYCDPECPIHARLSLETARAELPQDR